MKKTAAIAIDAVLFVVLLFCWTVALILAAGFLEIIFGWNIIFSTAGMIALPVLALAASTYFCFLLPGRKHGKTVGTSLAFTAMRPGNRFAPLFDYGRLLGIMLASYIMIWLVSAAVFGAMVRRQQRIIQTMGMPARWQDCFPAYATEDNAAPFLKLAADSLGTGTPGAIKINPAFTAVVGNSDTIGALTGVIDGLVSGNRSSLRYFNEAARCSKLIWLDYRGLSADSLIRVPVPNYLRMAELNKLFLLEGLNAVHRGDWARADAAFGRSVALVRLQIEDPTLIGKMTALANCGAICDGLAAAGKLSRDKAKAYRLSNRTILGLPPLAGRARQGMVAEFATIIALLERFARDPREMYGASYLFGSGSTANRAGVYLLGAVFYRVWGPWDQYCYLKTAEFSLAVAEPGIDRETLLRRERETGRFLDRTRRFPALFTSIAMPSFGSMQKRELEARAKTGAALLFAAMLDFRARRGHYPADLGQLVPDYFPAVPADPMGGAYRYTFTPEFVQVCATGFDGAPIPASTRISFR